MQAIWLLARVTRWSTLLFPSEVDIDTVLHLITGVKAATPVALKNSAESEKGDFAKMPHHLLYMIVKN